MHIIGIQSKVRKELVKSGRNRLKQRLQNSPRAKPRFGIREILEEDSKKATAKPRLCA